MAKRKQAHAGGHGWFVTFADLMGLLVSFFVMLVAFSNQDQKKLQIVAGSMRDAFGVQTNVRYSGVIEVDGLPTRPKLKNAAHIDPEDASATPTSDEQDHKREHGAHLKNDQAFALAAASLRQALQDMPELAEASKHIMVEETKEGLNIDLVDQEGRSMFPEGSKEPYERPAASSRSSPDRSRPRPIGSRSPATPRHRKCRPRRTMVLGICPPTGPMRSGKSSRKKAFRRATSTRWPAGRIPIRSFARILTLRPIAG
jgi:hypothetical protein